MKKQNFTNTLGLYASLWHAGTQLPKKLVIYVHGGPGSHCEDFETALNQIPEYADTPVAWLTYDQRGCGRSGKTANVTHGQNRNDLLSMVQEVQNSKMFDSVSIFGHSYGARLAFEVCEQNPELNVSVLLAGRSLHSEDSMNVSTLMDTYLLRSHYPELAEKAYVLLKETQGIASTVGREIRELFPSDSERQKLRAPFYWGNLQAMAQFEQWKANLTCADSDEVFYSVQKSIRESQDNKKFYNPENIKQQIHFIVGHFDFMMVGAANLGVDSKFYTRLNGSGHYPHFEQPREFLKILSLFI